MHDISLVNLCAFTIWEVGKCPSLFYLENSYARSSSWIVILYILIVFTLSNSIVHHLMWRADSLEKTLMPGKIEARRWRRQQRMRWLDGIIDSMNVEFEWTPGDTAGQGSLVYCSPWGHRVRRDRATEQWQIVLQLFNTCHSHSGVLSSRNYVLAPRSITPSVAVRHMEGTWERLYETTNEPLNLGLRSYARWVFLFVQFTAVFSHKLSCIFQQL